MVRARCGEQWHPDSVWTCSRWAREVHKLYRPEINRNMLDLMCSCQKCGTTEAPTAGGDGRRVIDMVRHRTCRLPAGRRIFAGCLHPCHGLVTPILEQFASVSSICSMAHVDGRIGGRHGLYCPQNRASLGTDSTDCDGATHAAGRLACGD